MKHFYRVIPVAVVVVVMLSGSLAAWTARASATGTASGWTPVRLGGGGGQYNAVNDVTCASTVFCVAVGDTAFAVPGQGGGTYVKSHSPLIESYNGGSWSSVTPPPLKGEPDAELIGVSCGSPRFCMAVGFWTPPPNGAFSGAQHNELIDIYHDGIWSLDEDTNPGSAYSAALSGVSCVSLDFCQAVGTIKAQQGGYYGALVEEYDGSAWTSEAAPEYSIDWNSFLESVSCPSVDYCMAVGGALPFSGPPIGSPFDQTIEGANPVPFAATFIKAGNEPGQWAPTPILSAPPDYTLFGVSCVSSTFCAAVGSAPLQEDGGPASVHYMNGALATWNGSKWTEIQAPAPALATAAGVGLYGVECVSTRDCLAVGGYSWLNSSPPPNGSFWTDPLFETYDGSSWTAGQGPALTDDQFETLLGVSCDKHQDCVTVGTYAPNLVSGSYPQPYFSSSMIDLGFASGTLVPPPPGEGTLIVGNNVFASGTGNGTVTSSPNGIDCPPRCSASFKTGTKVTLHAVAASNSVVEISQQSVEGGSCTPGWTQSAAYVSQTCTTTVSGFDFVDFNFDEFAPGPLTVAEYGAAGASDEQVMVVFTACSGGASSYSFTVDGKSVGPPSTTCEAAVPLALGPHSASVLVEDSDGLRKETLNHGFDVVPDPSFDWTVAPIPYGSNTTGTPTNVAFDACGSGGAQSYTWHFAGSHIPDKTTTSCKLTAQLPVGAVYATTLTTESPTKVKASTTQSVDVPAEYAPPPPCSYLDLFGANSCWAQGWDWFKDAFGLSGAPMRPPDFAVLQVGIGVASGSVTVTCDGNVFYGGGVSLSAGVSPDVSGVLAFGYVGDPTEGEPSDESIDGFVEGLGGSLSLSAVGAGASIIASSSGSWGVAYFSGWTGPSVSVGLSYNFGDPSNQDPGPNASCDGGVTSSATWQQLANNSLQSADGLPNYSPAAPSPAVQSGASAFVGAPEHTFASDTEVTVSVVGVRGANVATRANDKGQLGSRIKFPVNIGPGLHHLVFTGISAKGTAEANYGVRLPVVAASAGKGAWLATSDGGVTPLGYAKSFPLRNGHQPKSGVVGFAGTPDGGGYWSVTSAGAVAAYGDAHIYPLHGGALKHATIGIAATADGLGYWIADDSGDVAAYGDASSFPTGHAPVTGTVAAIAATPDGGGYWIVNSAGEVWAFGDAKLAKLSSGIQPTGHVVALVPDLNAAGYWLVTSAGSVASFGAARVEKGPALVGTIAAMAATPNGAGYWLASTVGHVFAFGAAVALAPSVPPHGVVALADI